jgi:hypothetical protein
MPKIYPKNQGFALPIKKKKSLQYLEISPDGLLGVSRHSLGEVYFEI